MYIYFCFSAGETFQEAVTDVTAVRVLKQSGVERQILDTGKNVGELK